MLLTVSAIADKIVRLIRCNMTLRESAIISAFTGVSFGGKPFREFHKYVEEKFGHSIFTHEMANQSFWDKLKELAREDFNKLAESIE